MKIAILVATALFLLYALRTVFKRE